VAERLGDGATALAYYQRSLPIARALAEANPSHSGFQKDLALTERRLARLQAKPDHND